MSHKDPIDKQSPDPSPDPAVPQTFYEFELVRPDGRTQRVVISEEGLFCAPPAQAFELHLDPLRS